ncbi:hypothetical protein [Halalkalibacter urbisdiaboli]|uniref:hypothetical protein n=1 Tax=Halalkalibacter urbisdiaboli TaxID=1960589 RepID=UPI000B454043|nr:hypothetical protein [Halalkalibacter urbisdiaboli]
MNRILKYVACVGLIASLVACGAVEEDRNEADTPLEETEEHTLEEEPVVDNNQDGEESDKAVDEPKEEEELPTEEAPADAIELADEKEIDVHVEGETEKRLAQFNRAPLGYGIYILQDYTLVSEEPNSDVIFSNFDEEFFTRIKSLGKETDLEEVKQTILEHASGTIHENIDIPLEGAVYAILEEVEIDGLKTGIIHTAKKYEENVLSFTVYLPLKEAAEGIGPSMWAMLDTIEY